MKLSNYFSFMAKLKSEDIYQVTWLIRRSFRLMGVRVDQYLADLDISACDRSVMDYLYPSRKLSVPQIASLYDVSRQFIQSTVNSLHEREIVQFLDNPKHKRSPLVSLTEKGAGLYEQIRIRDEAAFRKIFSGISESDNQTTYKTLKTLVDNLSNEIDNNH